MSWVQKHNGRAGNGQFFQVVHRKHRHLFQNRLSSNFNDGQCTLGAYKEERRVILPRFWCVCQNKNWGTVFNFLSESPPLVVSLSDFKACELLECIAKQKKWSHGVYTKGQIAILVPEAQKVSGKWSPVQNHEDGPCWWPGSGDYLVKATDASRKNKYKYKSVKFITVQS